MIKEESLWEESEVQSGKFIVSKHSVFLKGPCLLCLVYILWVRSKSGEYYIWLLSFPTVHN